MKESNLLEVRTWTHQAKLYITEGYITSPPKKGIFRYIAPLLQQIWITACSHGGDPEERSLEELIKSIEDEANLRQPKHTRCMILLKNKRGSDKHTDFLEKIVENYSVVEFEQMTGEELMIHLFIRDADPQMRKLATEILQTEKLTFHQLRTKVKETEAAV